MDTVIRAAVIYTVLLLVFRIAGKRTLGDMSTFDLLLTLIISEATQQAMVGDDHSVTGAILLIGTLVGLDITLSILKQQSPTLARVIDGIPVVVLQRGKLVQHAANEERVDIHDVLAAARQRHGIERADQIKYAIVEQSGTISIIPVSHHAS